MARYREIRPSAPLRSFINTFWLLEHDGEDAAQQQRVVPDGHSELILNWSHPFQAFEPGGWRGQPRSFFAGQIDGPLLLRPHGPAKMLGVGFHPHGAARLFAHPMHELSGRFTPVQDLSQTLSRHLDRAFESPDPVAAVEAALLAAERTPRDGDLMVAEAVRRMIFAKGTLDIAILARELGLSTRQFERRFDAVVGLRPKLFCRIQRFSQVFGLLTQPSANWAETAIACGYYDQAHLIRDCRSLSGTTPAVLLGEDADLARHFYMRFGMSHSYNTARCVSA